MAEWFEDWFGETYLQLYQHRGDDDAADAVALIAEEVLLTGRLVLDLACGSGRHSALVRNRDARTVGIDLSGTLLRRARTQYEPPLTVVRGDMRNLPFKYSCFDVVLNLFTSFGYFKTDDQHRQVLEGVARIIKRGGCFVLDFLNADMVKDRLVPEEEQQLDGRRITINKRISDDGKFVYKQMNFVDEGRQFEERVRLFSPEELESMLSKAGFTIRKRFGGYRGEPLNPDSSRVFLITERS